MKKVLVVLFILLTSAVILAQTEQEKEEALGGKYSLQFAVGSNFSFNSFQGSVFSGKIMLNDKLALRTGLTASVKNSTLEEDYADETFSDKEESSSYTIDLNAHLLFNLVSNNTIKFYAGGGPSLGISSGSAQNRYTRDEFSSNYYGLDLVNGVEWFVKNNISLFGEYGLRFKYTDNSSTRKESSITIREFDRTIFSIGEMPVKLGVSLYF